MKLTKLIISAAIAFSFGAAQATVIDNTAGGVSALSAPTFSDTAGDVATFGETFSFAVASTMTSFSLYLTGGSTAAVDFKGYVSAWNSGNGKLNGSILYTSAIQHFSGAANQEFSFNTGSLALSAGSTYVVFLSTLGNAAAPFGTAQIGTGSAYAGGNLFYSDSNAFSKLSSAAWTSTTADAAFKVDAGAVPATGGTVPEPASLALFGLALGGAAMVRRRKRA